MNWNSLQGRAIALGLPIFTACSLLLLSQALQPNQTAVTTTQPLPGRTPTGVTPPIDPTVFATLGATEAINPTATITGVPVASPSPEIPIGDPRNLAEFDALSAKNRLTFLMENSGNIPEFLRGVLEQAIFRSTAELYAQVMPVGDKFLEGIKGNINVLSNAEFDQLVENEGDDPRTRVAFVRQVVGQKPEIFLRQWDPATNEVQKSFEKRNWVGELYVLPGAHELKHYDATDYEYPWYSPETTGGDLVDWTQVPSDQIMYNSIDRYSVIAGFKGFAPYTVSNRQPGEEVATVRVSPGGEEAMATLTTVTFNHRAGLGIENRFPANYVNTTNEFMGLLRNLGIDPGNSENFNTLYRLHSQGTGNEIISFFNSGNSTSENPTNTELYEFMNNWINLDLLINPSR